MTDDELYTRAGRTLLASWEAYTGGCPDAFVARLGGVTAAVFPSGPERGVYNNAVLDRRVEPGRRDAAIGAMEDAYRAAGVDRFAAWVHESDDATRTALSERGYKVDEVTRAMSMSLDDVRSPAVDVEFAAITWPEYVEYLVGTGAPAGLLSAADPEDFHVLAIRRDGEVMATGLAFDHDDDCGVFNVSTTETARRQGLGTAITAGLVRDAVARGCRTASLQSSAMAERVYASVGFRDLGRIIEFVA